LYFGVSRLFCLSGNFSRRYQISVLASIAIARALYSLNWYTLAPGLSQVELAFHASLENLGILESAFLAGAGLFQLPSAYAAARWNAKAIIISGLGVLALANILASFSSSLTLLILFRFLLGVGAAMFFSPAITVVAPLFSYEKQGFALGIYNAAFNIGGSIALLGWVYVVDLYSWRGGLLLGGLLVLPVIPVLFFVVRHSEKRITPKLISPERAVARVVRNKQIWYVGLGIIGMWSASYAISQFLPYFEIRVNDLPASFAGLLTSLTFIAPIPGSVLGGWLSDRWKNRKGFLVYPTIAYGLGTALIGYSKFNESLLLLSFLGVIQSFAFVSMYAAPFQMENLSLDQKAISISLMNSVQILGAFILPIAFAVVATSSGYLVSWIFAGIFTIAFVPFLLLFKEPFKIARNSKPHNP
jgi:MFS family permease